MNRTSTTKIQYISNIRSIFSGQMDFCAILLYIKFEEQSGKIIQFTWKLFFYLVVLQHF